MSDMQNGPENARQYETTVRNDRKRDTERNQALVRTALVALVYVYSIAGVVFGAVDSSYLGFFHPYFVATFAISAGILLSVLRWPGVNHIRRSVAIVFDVSSTCVLMIAGTAYFTPLFAVLVWVTVGYGMRFGTTYLALATVAALVGLAAVLRFSDYMQGQAYVSATFVVTLIIVPLYARMLLARLRKAYDAAIETNRSKSQILAQASHDLRQPVQAISLTTARLKQSPLDPDDRQMVENIDRSLYGITGLFRSLLDVSTLDSGRITPTPVVVDIASFYKQIAQQNEAAAGWANVDIRIPETSIKILTDPGLLSSILQNLLSNAFKYAANGKVLLGCRKQGGRVSLIFMDNGPGITEDEQSRIFDPFHRVRKAGVEIEGVGLGLSIVKRMAELLDVSISLRSQPGKGACFRIDGFQEVDTEVLPAAGGVLTGTPLDGLRVMLVNEDRVRREALLEHVERWGCRVCAAGDASVSDIIVLDCRDVSVESCTDVLSDPEMSKTPAIVIVNDPEAEVRSALGNIEASVLSTPLRMAELRAVMLSLVLRESKAGVER